MAFALGFSVRAAAGIRPEAFAAPFGALKAAGTTDGDEAEEGLGGVEGGRGGV